MGARGSSESVTRAMEGECAGRLLDAYGQVFARTEREVWIGRVRYLVEFLEVTGPSTKAELKTVVMNEAVVLAVVAGLVDVTADTGRSLGGTTAVLASARVGADRVDVEESG